MKKLLFFTIIVIFAFPGVSNGFSSGPYFPLSSGALWTFQSNGSGSYTTTVLPGVENINGTDTKMLQYWDGAVDYFTNDGYGIRLHAEYLPADESIPESWGSFNPPIKIAEADSTLGVPVYSSGTATVQITGYGSFIFHYTSTVMPQAFESVTVPAGTFIALRVQWTQNIWGTVYGTPISQIRNVTYWMAPNIGPVRQIDPYTTFTLIYSTLIDTTPDAFTFLPQTDVPLSTTATSNSITVTGLTVGASVNITGGEYRIDSGGWTSGPGTITTDVPPYQKEKMIFGGRLGRFTGNM